MTNTSRQQQVVERILEDERLRGDLDDSAAKTLLDWATARAGGVAADTTQSDEQVESAAREVRKATLVAARSGESDPRRLVALAEAALPELAAPTAAIPAQRADAPTAATGLAAQGALQAGAGAGATPIERAIQRPRRSRLARLLKQLRGRS